MTHGRRRLLALTILAVGALIMSLGVTAALGYEALLSETPTTTTASTGSTSDSLLSADLGLALRVGMTEFKRDFHLSPTVGKAAPVPGLTFDRDVETHDVKAPVGAGLDVDVRSGSHAASASQSGSDTTTQSGQVAMLNDAVPTATLAAAAFATAGLVVYFWAAIKTFAYKVLVLPLVPLYAHITRSQVFDNDVRERIFTAIRDEPGVSASQLSRAAGVSWGTTVYHLDVLEQTKMISSLRDGRYRRYFQNGQALDTSKEIVSCLKNDTTNSVASAIVAAPGTTQKELAATVGMSPQALHWHLTRLVKAGIIEKRRDGRVVRHFALA